MKTIEKDYLKVSFGNSKLPKGTMIFNLPAVITCPLRTPLCEKSCYALKAEVQYRHVVPQARHHNLDRVRKGLFKGLMIEAIQKHHKKIKAIRIHESGDFLSQSYLNDWFAIAKEFPKTVRPIDQLTPEGRPIADPVAPLSERIGPAFADELARVNAEEQRIAEKFPFKTGAAEVGADILALTLGKAPFTKSIKAAEAGFATKKFAESMTNPGTRKVVEAVRDSAAFTALKRGTGRTAETSTEALILSVFNDGDQLETAAWAVGGQASGSVVFV